MTNLFPFARVVTLGSVGVAVTLCVCLQVQTSAQQAGRQQVASPPSSPAAGAVTPASSARRLLDRYCVTCHNERLKTADLRLDRIDVANPGAERRSLGKGRAQGAHGHHATVQLPQPSQDDRRALLTWLETSLDAASAARPNPGRTDTLRRLNRTEYQNAVRDLLALDIDAASLLPPDDSGHGFDNVTVGDLPPGQPLTEHFAINDYPAETRIMRRIAVCPAIRRSDGSGAVPGWQCPPHIEIVMPSETAASSSGGPSSSRGQAFRGYDDGLLSMRQMIPLFGPGSLIRFLSLPGREGFVQVRPANKSERSVAVDMLAREWGDPIIVRSQFYPIDTYDIFIA